MINQFIEKEAGGRGQEELSLWSFLKYSGIDVLVEEVSLDIFVPENATGIHVTDQI